MKFYTHVYHTKIYKVSLSAQEPKPNRNSVIRSFILGITHVPKQTPPRALTIKLNKTLILQDIRVLSDRLEAESHRQGREIRQYSVFFMGFIKKYRTRQLYPFR